MKKNILIILILLLLTGCKVESNVKMNSDGTVEEHVSVLGNIKLFKSPKYDIEDMIEFSLEEYKTALNYRKYNYIYKIEKSLAGATFNKKYNNICEYFKDTGFNQYVYNHIKCQESDNYIEISNDTEYIPYCNDCSDWPALNDIKFYLTLPIKPVNHNADVVKDDVYIWEFGESVNYDKKFYLKIDKNSLTEYNENQKKSQKKSQKIKVISYILITIITIIVIAFIFYRKYKKNKLEY